tara:strand:- start:1769 stop:2371 length:603 start_codon:yes stop_codon:yes gene_type:complete
MQDFVSFFLLLVVITIFYVHLENKALNVIYVKSKLDNKEYLVRNLPDKQQACELLAQLNTKFKRMIQTLEESLSKSNNYNSKQIDDIKRLKSNYNENYISESSPGNKHTSYSINKGEKIVFCLRSKDGKDTLVDINTITFVGIHELAHLMTKSIGHEPEFWENMKFLLNIAIDYSLYFKQDFRNTPIEYCGTKITDSPII